MQAFLFLLGSNNSTLNFPMVPRRLVLARGARKIGGKSSAEVGPRLPWARRWDLFAALSSASVCRPRLRGAAAALRRGAERTGAETHTGRRRRRCRGAMGRAAATTQSQRDAHRAQRPASAHSLHSPSLSLTRSLSLWSEHCGVNTVEGGSRGASGTAVMLQKASRREACCCQRACYTSLMIKLKPKLCIVGCSGQISVRAFLKPKNGSFEVRT